MEERQTILRVTGMTCAGCARRVERALRSLDDVASVTIQLREGTATVRHGEGASLAEFRAALAEAGYPLADDAAA